MNVDSSLNPDKLGVQIEEKPSDHMAVDSDTRSDASFDPLFDDVPEESLKPQTNNSYLDQPLGPPPPSTKPPPQGAPPLLDPVDYSTYSPELLMTAFIDGQVILWDRRANTSGKGVGRLWMSDNTPPWCLSVCISHALNRRLFDLTLRLGMLVCRRLTDIRRTTERNSRLLGRTNAGTIWFSQYASSFQDAPKSYQLRCCVLCRRIS